MWLMCTPDNLFLQTTHGWQCLPSPHALCGLPLTKDPALLKAITSRFFLETGELFSEHKLLVAFPAEASAWVTPPPPLHPFSPDLLHFQQVKTVYF